jgi:hypothetical protein
MAFLPAVTTFYNLYRRSCSAVPSDAGRVSCAGCRSRSWSLSRFALARIDCYHGHAQTRPCSPALSIGWRATAFVQFPRTRRHHIYRLNQRLRFLPPRPAFFSMIALT